MGLFWLGLFVVGMTAGSLGALLGLGGGIFLVPALTLIFDLPVRTAVGVSLIGVIATSAGVAIVSHPGRGADIGLALRLEIATTSGALIGGFAAGLLPDRALALMFAVVVLSSAAYTFIKTRKKAGPASEPQIESLFRTEYQPKRWRVGLSFSALAGALSGLSGIGGGFIKVPVMYSIMDVPLGVATATSNFMVGITAAAERDVVLQSRRHKSAGGRAHRSRCVCRRRAWGAAGQPDPRGSSSQAADRASGPDRDPDGLEGHLRRLTVLDDLIAKRAGEQDQARRIARNIQRIARLVAIPAALIMLAGMIAFELRGGLTGELLSQAVIPLRAILSRAALSPIGAMSIGLLALSLLPMANVLYILVDSLLHGHWKDAGAAAAVAAILTLGIILGHA